MRRAAGWLALALLLGGCVSSEVVLRGDGRRGGAVEVAHQGRHLLLVDAGQGVRLDDGQRFRRSATGLERHYRPALRLQPAPPRRFQLYLGDDGKLNRASSAIFEQVLATIRRQAPAAVRVVGHTDTLGDAALNERVGLRRAQQVARMLKAEGVEMLRLQVASHGEADPLVPTPDDTAEPLNRRVEVSVQ